MDLYYGQKPILTVDISLFRGWFYTFTIQKMAELFANAEAKAHCEKILEDLDKFQLEELEKKGIHCELSDTNFRFYDNNREGLSLASWDIQKNYRVVRTTLYNVYCKND